MGNEVHLKFKIQRRDSLYNKYIKWFRVSFDQDGQEISSIGYKTEREARNFKLKYNMPIGNKIIEYIYEEVK